MIAYMHMHMHMHMHMRTTSKAHTITPARALMPALHHSIDRSTQAWTCSCEPMVTVVHQSARTFDGFTLAFPILLPSPARRKIIASPSHPSHRRTLT